MERILTLIVFVTFFHIGYSQNPFHQFGDKSKILTMTNGKFNEFHDQDSVVQIGSILLDVNKKIIVAYINEDTVPSMPSPTFISRWWSIDPMAEKYYNMSPYNFVANNPILFVDHNGDSISLNEKNQGGISGFQSIVSQGSGGFYQADVDATTGMVTMNSTGQAGKMTKEQKKFVKEMTDATTGSAIATINVTVNSEQVVIGDIASKTIDVGDMAAFGTDGKVTAAQTLVHEVKENYEVSNGATTGVAHQMATNAENRVSTGAITSARGRYITPSSTMPGFGTLEIPITAPASQKGTVNVTLYKNNVLYINGNRKAPTWPK